jgi:glycosyltransferase involved in cell wall biosynthesis
MTVTFVLPGGAALPSGGTRMVFRYANALAEEGWRVNIVMPSDSNPTTFWPRIARRGRYWLSRFTRGYSPHRWMRLHEAVKLFWVPTLALAAHLPPADVVVATAVRTAEAVADWPRQMGRKFYFVQGYETWDFPAERVLASWRLPFTKIAVSRWLLDLMAGAGEHGLHLSNSLDHATFGLDRSPESRQLPKVLWPHHSLRQKGSADAIAALQRLQRDWPSLQVQAFGTTPSPQAETLRVDYFRNPPQLLLRRLYNEATVMIAPSHAEGWGLPACEALQCGCALAASDIGGHREFLRHEHNALLHPPGDVSALHANVLRLLGDPALRARLARQGIADMAELTLAKSVARLKSFLQSEAPK